MAAEPHGAPGSGTAEYCALLQRWMWDSYRGYACWHSRLLLSVPPPCGFPPPGSQAWSPAGGGVWPAGLHPYVTPAASSHPAAAEGPRGGQQPGGDPPARAGREYVVASPLHRLLAETVDFFILFCVKASILLWILHMSGMKDIANVITHFIVEEIDENTSLEDLQKMMVVALVYRLLVCVYEIVCIWGSGGATPGKFLLGLQVVTCDTSTPVRPGRVLVAPATGVSFSASTVRALNKNFSIAFLFPVFISLLFFKNNRTVYDVVAGTIVVQRRRGR